MEKTKSKVIFGDSFIIYKEFYEYFESGVTEFHKHPEDFIIFDDELEYDVLSNNIYINIDQIVNNPHISWDFDDLSKNPAISTNDVIKYPHLPWNYDNMVFNPNIDIKFIYSKYDGLDVLMASQYRYIDEILNNEHIIDWDGNFVFNGELLLSNGKNIGFNELNMLFKLFDDQNLRPNWHNISEKINIDIETIVATKNNEKYKWKINNLSRNKNISMNDIEKYCHLKIKKRPWDFRYLLESGKANLPKHIKICFDNLENDGDGSLFILLALINNHQITKKYIKTNINTFASHIDLSGYFIHENHLSDANLIQWHSTPVTLSPNINIITVTKYLNFKWDWEELHLNPTISCEDVLKNIDLPWEYERILYKECFSWQHILLNQDFNKKIEVNGSIMNDHLLKGLAISQAIVHMQRLFRRNNKYKKISKEISKSGFYMCNVPKDIKNIVHLYLTYWSL